MEPPRVIFLNGASSSGKTDIATILQTDLPGIWMHLSSDALFRGQFPRVDLPDLYDLTVDTSDMRPAECANVVIGATSLADQ